MTNLESEKNSVKAVINKFSKFWETGDMKILSEVFSHDPDIVLYGTDAPEHWIGWEPFRQTVEQMIQVLEDVRITIKEQHIFLHSSGDVAWFSQIWDWDFKAEGSHIHSEGQRLTGVLEKRSGNWVLVQIHNSVAVKN